METEGQSEVYKDHAKKWIIEAITVSIVGAIVHVFLYFLFGGYMIIPLSILVYMTVLIINVGLLFRHVDTLIMKRINQAKEGNYV